MRVSIVGARGQLGRELVATVPEGWTVTAFGRSELDVTRSEQVRERLEAARPDVIVNASAYTAVDRAEDEPEAAFAVNADGAGHVASAATRIGARLIHISTDFVFDGRQSTPYEPDAAPNPIGVYGRSKWAGEQQVVALTGGSAAIIRTAWLYSANGPDFVASMLRLMRERRAVRVVADQVGTPTWTRPLCAAIWACARLELVGTWHWTDAGVASWYDFAVSIRYEALRLGLLQGAVTVEPVRSVDFPTQAVRPRYSVLDKTSTWVALGLPVHHWAENLGRMMSDLRDTPPSR